LHVARKYLGHRWVEAQSLDGSVRYCAACSTTDASAEGTCPALAFAEDYLARAHYEACLVAAKLGVPAAFMPRAEFGALRVLEYPSAGHKVVDACEGAAIHSSYCMHCKVTDWALNRNGVCPVLAAGAGTAEHTDPDLFTLNLWRSTSEDHERQYTRPRNGAEMAYPREDTLADRTTWVKGAQAWHVGRIGEIIGLGPAVKHRVPARPYTQQALVYFAIPDHAAVLPGDSPHDMQPNGYCGRCNGNGRPGCPLTVGQYLERELARMRVRK
jgi:hypothetical protein